MKKNEEFIIKIEDMSEDGAGIGKQDGYIWFVKDTVIGDVIRAGAMKMKKNYGFARLIEVLTPSGNRIQPRCPVARQCGGCQLQAMDYQAQLQFKERKVYSNLCRIGGLKDLKPEDMEPIMGMEDPWRYRNKAQFPFGTDKNGRIITGFYAGRTHAIIMLLIILELTGICCCLPQFSIILESLRNYLCSRKMIIQMTVSFWGILLLEQR